MPKWFDSMLEEFSRVVRRAAKRGPRYPSEKERRVLGAMHGEGIRRELANRSAASLEYEERQQLAYWGLWRLIRPADSASIPPDSLDMSVPEHVTLALTVVGDYDAAREEPGEFADCLYRPVSDLPYPQAAIRRCCELLISIADTDAGSSDKDHDLLATEREALGLALFSLDYFLDLPASEIPRRKLENLAYVKDQYLARSMPPVKPGAGDTILRTGSGMTDYVDQVIGLGDNDEWMVLTNSGDSMQVVRSSEPGKWDEVKVVAPAAASWLTLTPTGGISSWGL
jgi:hypothetical protein